MEHLPTGKNKEQFGVWYFDNDLNIDMDLGSFRRLPIQMQQGVLLAFYDSLDMWIRVDLKSVSNDYVDNIRSSEWSYFISQSAKKRNFDSRLEACKAAFKKANEIRNDQLKLANLDVLDGGEKEK